MIITCTNCKTSFVAPDTAIGTSGRNVKCSKCQNIWFVTLPPKPRAEINNFTIPSTQALQGSFNLPTVSDNNIGWYLYMLPMLLGLMLITVYILLFPNEIFKFTNSDFICQKFAICDTSGIKFKNIKLEEVHQGATKVTVLSYGIINENQVVKHMPIIRIRLLNKENQVIKSHIALSPQVLLKPLYSHFVKTRFDDIPDNIENIELSIGNRLELLFR